MDEHRRGDRERLGWMRPEGEGFVVIDLLGRELTGAVDWFEAETMLDELGIGYLAEPLLLLGSGQWLRVRIMDSLRASLGFHAPSERAQHRARP
ncbi:MAG: hypothetical protein KF761_07130 [Salinibacterium sp.]|nr:hypothetical protein [Salinibacterium sp.]